MGVLLPWIPVRLFQAVASLTEARCRVSQWEGVSRPPLQGLRPLAKSESCLALILMFQSFAESGSPRPEKKRDSLERFEVRSRGPLFYRKRGTCSVQGNNSGCISRAPLSPSVLGGGRSVRGAVSGFCRATEQCVPVICV